MGLRIHEVAFLDDHGALFGLRDRVGRRHGLSSLA
jgi:hypothetical protein